MPKSTKFDESSLHKACEAAQAQEKPNITKIATLRDRVKKGRQPRTARKPVNKLLEGYQEEALRLWLVHMRDSNMPVTPRILEAWANRALIRAGKPGQQVSKMWAYRFEKRLPAHLKLGPVKQKTKESRLKISKHTDVLTPKIQRNLQRIFEHNRIAAEHLAMANDTISQIRAAQAPLRVNILSDRSNHRTRLVY
ncbi:hypothetical protein GB937_010838 [Aspergillus fischeri]|nr:hypothetical protein GB937_010838 [Aspergillus fischeri]